MQVGARCLVTGAGGLLGSHIAERLVESGERVRALVRTSQRRPPSWSRWESRSSMAT